MYLVGLGFDSIGGCSAAAWLEGADAERATSLAYSILEYLYETDYTKYFNNMAKPTSAQEMEFLKFSLQCAKAATVRIDEFVQLLPLEAVEAARTQGMTGASQ
eukprot:TRINITY_DN1130_c0_g3_i4.p1 TRINITY_DN1130_c0_g3~~TRINITY_DN1130_c0_g3_i4.p1  ORF type:complete len:103 (+),score=8.91 TRINITY_DN1130_c0_g3_i4:238-546(+)